MMNDRVFFWGDVAWLVRFWNEVVSGSGSAPSVFDIWAMRDDGLAMKPVWSTIKKHPTADLVLFSKRAD